MDPCVGCVQPQQCFGTVIAPVLRSALRLVVQASPAVTQGVPQNFSSMDCRSTASDVHRWLKN